MSTPKVLARVFVFLLLVFPLFTSALFENFGGRFFPFLGSFMTDIPQTLDLEEKVPSPLSFWSHDKVQDLCRAFGDRHNAQDILSTTHIGLGDISAPTFFQNISIRGNWSYVSKRLLEMRDCPTAAFQYVR